MKTRTDYHRKNFGNVQISKRIMSQKLFKFFYKKHKLKKKLGEFFLIKVPFFTAFDKLCMVRTFLRFLKFVT